MAAFANAMKMVNITQVMHYPREAYTFLEKTQHPAGVLAFKAISSDPVQNAWRQFTTLLDQYSRYLIPLFGILFQLYMSNKARTWAERRQERTTQEALAANTQQQAPAASGGAGGAAGAKGSGTSSATKASGPGTPGSSKKRK